MAKEMIFEIFLEKCLTIYFLNRYISESEKGVMSV